MRLLNAIQQTHMKYNRAGNIKPGKKYYIPIPIMIYMKKRNGIIFQPFAIALPRE